MKTILTHVVQVSDTRGNVLFSFPSGTLLDRIVDPWYLIIDYHDHYFPFTISQDDNEHYREITLQECQTEKFDRLFKFSYKKNGGIYALRDSRILLSVEGYPLHINNDRVIARINFYKNNIKFTSLERYVPDIVYTDRPILGDIKTIQIDPLDEKYKYNHTPLLVQRDIFFD